jgi:hypothetical protein
MRKLTPALVLVAGGLVACQENGADTTPKTTKAAAEKAERQAMRPGSQPAEGAPAAENIPAAMPKISGTIVLGEGLSADTVKDTDVIFVMARTREGGNLVATEIIEDVKFPASFSLDEKDIMVHGKQTQPPFMLSARLDRDQDAMTKGSDDLYAMHGTPLKGGETGVKLVLKKAPGDAVHGGSMGDMPSDAIHGGGGVAPSGMGDEQGGGAPTE